VFKKLPLTGDWTDRVENSSEMPGFFSGVGRRRKYGKKLLQNTRPSKK
jgi:hypothetical protein